MLKTPDNHNSNDIMKSIEFEDYARLCRKAICSDKKKQSYDSNPEQETDFKGIASNTKL